MDDLKQQYDQEKENLMQQYEQEQQNLKQQVCDDIVETTKGIHVPKYGFEGAMYVDSLPDT